MSQLFTIIHSDKNTSARAGILRTDHGDFSTPCFMPVGTYGAVKTQSSEEIADLPSPILLGNTGKKVTNAVFEFLIFIKNLFQKLYNDIYYLIKT